MTIKLKRSDLQTDKYNYVWTRDDGDGKYIGPKDQKKVDKDEGYEVLEFIENFINDNSMTKQDVHAVEDALHHPDLSDVVERSDLNTEVKKKLK